MSLGEWLEYALVNFSAAAAIAIDACILVLLKFRGLSTRAVALQWAGAVGLTHVMFPMVGFIGGWYVIQHYRLAVGVYSLGATLLGILLCLVLREAIDPHPDVANVSTGSAAACTKILAFWIPVINVSLDALLSGPGKTVLLERYPTALAWLSFLIVGLLVALFTLIAGGVSLRIHNRWIAGRLASPAGLAQGIIIGVIGEIALFSFFLVWCIAKTAENLPSSARLRIPFLFVTLAGLVLGGSLSGAFYRRIQTAQQAKATLAMGLVGMHTQGSEASRREL